MAQQPFSILVATDLSARSDRAVDRAAALARKRNGRLRVVHAVEAGEPRGQAELERAVRTVLPEPAADVDVLLPRGSAPEAIAKCADDTASAVIVTGVARYNHFGDYFLGNAIDYVIRNTNVPVLVVKQRPHADYRTLLVPTDFTERSHVALLTAAQLFPDAALHLVHAFRVPFEGRLDTLTNRAQIDRMAQEKLDGYLNGAAFPPGLRARIQTRLGYGERHLVVGEAIGDFAPDLVVLVCRGRSALGQAFVGDSVQAWLCGIEPDTLVVRA